MMTSIVNLLLWPFKRCKDVIVNEQRPTLGLCEDISITGRIVSTWAKLLALPQFFIAPIFGLVFGYEWMTSIFLARMMAILIVGELNKIFPYQRAAGLCHILTFGPLFLWMNLVSSSSLSNEDGVVTTVGTTEGLMGLIDILYHSFMGYEYYTIGICLFLDIRDLIYYLLGKPYVCYIREATIKGRLKINDPRATEPVTWMSRIVGP